MPIPQDEEASTQKSMDEVTGGFDRVEPQKSRDNCVHHQSMSARTREVGVFRMKGDDV